MRDNNPTPVGVSNTSIPISIEDGCKPYSYNEALELLVSTLERMGIPVEVYAGHSITIVIARGKDSIHWQVYLHRQSHEQHGYWLDYKYPDGTGAYVGTVPNIMLVLAVVCGGVVFEGPALESYHDS